MSIHLPQSKHSSDKLVSPNEHKNVKEGESKGICSMYTCYKILCITYLDLPGSIDSNCGLEETLSSRRGHRVHREIEGNTCLQTTEVRAVQMRFYSKIPSFTNPELPKCLLFTRILIHISIKVWLDEENPKNGHQNLSSDLHFGPPPAPGPLRVVGRWVSPARLALKKSRKMPFIGFMCVQLNTFKKHPKNLRNSIPWKLQSGNRLCQLVASLLDVHSEFSKPIDSI